MFMLNKISESESESESDKTNFLRKYLNIV